MLKLTEYQLQFLNAALSEKEINDLIGSAPEDKEIEVMISFFRSLNTGDQIVKKIK